MRKGPILALVVLAASAAIAAMLFLPPAGVAQMARAQLNVEKMTCGSCIGKISDAVTALGGVGGVDVNLTLGQATIEYDPDELSPERLAAVITDAGYPSRVVQSLSAAEYEALKTKEEALAEQYVGRIGDTLIERADFQGRVQQLGTSNPVPENQLMAKVWQDYLQRTLLLDAAARAEVVVQDTEVDYEIEQLRTKMPQLDQWVASNYGSEDAFARRMKENMVINRLIEEQVLLDVEGEQARQFKLNSWYQNLSANAAVSVYDPALKQALSSASSGGCCGGSGGCGSAGKGV